MSHSPRRKSAAFSLVEILVAVAVLALLGMMIVQITSAVHTTTRLSTRAIDASAQARLAFERLSGDLGVLVKRADVDFHADNSGLTEALVFLSNTAAADPNSAAAGFQNRGSSYVSYRVAAHPDNTGRPCLIRGSHALGWGDRGYAGLTTNATTIRMTNTGFPVAFLPTASTATSPGDYDLLAPGVIRFVVGFQLYPDNNAVTLQDGTTIANARGQIVYSPPMRSGGIDLSRVSALVVGIVSGDVESLKLLSAAQISSLAALFVLPGTNQLPVALWTQTLNTPANFNNFPRPASQSLRVYQRFYPITPFTTQTK